jgi:hypothetical protein
MTTKISRAVAEQMAKAIVTHAHKDEVMPLLRQERALFKKLYDMQHPPELQAKMAELQAMLGEGQHTFVKGCNYVYVRSASGYSGRLHINPVMRGDVSLRMAGKTPAWRLAIEECPLALRSFDGDSHRLTGELSLEVEAFLTAHRAVEKKIIESEGKAINAILAFGTYKKLQAGWPEVLPLVQEYIPIAGQSTALAVCVSDLNIVFNLPPGEEPRSGEEQTND